MRTIYKCSNVECEAEVPIMTVYGNKIRRRCNFCGDEMYPIEDIGEQATESIWYPVPAYKGAKGYTGQPHILNQNGELVAVFENLDGPDGAQQAAEDHNRGQVLFDLAEVQ